MKNNKINIDATSQLAYKEKADRITRWMLVRLFDLGLTKFDTARRIRRFMRKHKVEFKYDYILNSLSLYVNGEFIERFDERHGIW